MTTAMRRAVGLVARDGRGRWVALLLVALCASLLEVVGAGLVYVLLGMVANPGTALDLPVVGDLRQRFPGVDETTLLLAMAAALAAFFVVRGAVQFGQAYLQARVGQQAGARLSRELVLGYLRLPYAFHVGRNSAELIRNAHSAVDGVVGYVFLPLIRLVAEAVTIVTLVTLLVVVAPLATGLAVLVVGTVSLLLLRWVQPRLQQLGWTSHELDEQTLRSLQQAMEGVRDVKLLGRETAFADVYGTWRNGLADVRQRHASIAVLPRVLMELALLGLVLAVFTVAVASGAGDVRDTLSVLGLFAYVGLRLQPSLQRLIGSLNALRYAQAPLRTVIQDLATIGALTVDDDTPVPFRDAIVFECVHLRHDGAARDALHDVDLRIEAGEVVGVCGPTGGGKTTLVDVLTGLLPPTRGRVTVDGHDLRRHARGWQQRLGVVAQHVFLVDDTIRHNIALGLDHDAIDPKALEDAVRLAQLEPLVAALPAGLDTVVGERGVRLSGGERQRIAIARALYRRPDVLVLDEGTSALDGLTEQDLLAALDDLRGAHTIVMVAHRLSTLQHCDRVVYVADGQVVADGSLEVLRQASPAFRAMAGDA